MKFAQGFPVLGLSVLALIASGCGGGGGSDNDDPPPADTTDPTVSIAALPATVNRTVDIEATASDAVGVTEVQFYVDGASLGTDTTAPYTASWNTSGLADGQRQITAVARDAAGNAGDSAAVTTTVRNQLEFAVTLSGEQEFPVTASAGSATGSIEVNAASGELTGSITVSGFTATAAHIHEGFAGVAGDILVGLQANAGNPNLWEIPAGSTLTSEQVTSLLAGGLYINAHSAAFPAGEARAQLLPSKVTLIFTDLGGAEEVPPVTTGASARAATSVDTDAGTVTINVNTVGLATANAAHIHAAPSGETGDAIVPLEQDATTPSLWFATGVEVTADQLRDFEANEWYVNVHTPANPDGEVRGQIIAVPPAPGPTPYTFAEIQTDIFNARCTGCHSGGAAPQGLNLSAGTSYGLLVNVASGEVPSLMRVAPGNADDSYIIRKLEGAAGIVGGRMPLGGPYLDQDTIDRIRAWIDSGAPNN